jgi:hypothetical protein
MQLPNREEAYVPTGKVTGYLLSLTHPIGHSKARWLRALGFDDSTADMLEQGLIAIAHTEEVGEALSSRHGTRYVIDGRLPTPSGETTLVRTVWIVDAGQTAPRFVTAYPARVDL